MTVRIPDEALVVRGGQNLPENFVKASGGTQAADGKLDGISVNSAPHLSCEELAVPNPQTGYPGIPNSQIGITTVGKLRAVGGDVVPAPTRTNPNHAILRGITPQQASELFSPTIANPARPAKK